MSIAKVEAERERFYFHWQNLNDRKDGTQGSGIREGRCWWRFPSVGGPVHDRTVQFEWNLWTHFCSIGFDISDEDLTISVAFPPVAFWLSFSLGWWLVSKLAPRKILDTTYYPDTIVVDERECKVAVHDGKVWINPWSKSGEWVKADPWWVRGVNFSINPFEWRHISHTVRCLDGSWQTYVGSWESGKQPDSRQLFEYPYRYVLKSGEVQDRTATVYASRMAWRPKCLQFTSLFEKVKTSIDVTFSDEVGERSGSWKGGCTGCSWELLDGETPEQSLRRMEAERKF